MGRSYEQLSLDDRCEIAEALRTTTLAATPSLARPHDPRDPGDVSDRERAFVLRRVE
jgi:hypothetical protein